MQSSSTIMFFIIDDQGSCDFSGSTGYWRYISSSLPRSWCQDRVRSSNPLEVAASVKQKGGGGRWAFRTGSRSDAVTAKREGRLGQEGTRLKCFIESLSQTTGVLVPSPCVRGGPLWAGWLTSLATPTPCLPPLLLDTDSHESRGRVLCTGGCWSNVFPWWGFSMAPTLG